jgi:XTP/dITP diphosphohydrolase
MRTLLIATHNPGKVREYRALLADLPLDLVSLDDVGITQTLAENGDTFEANAILKAEGYARLSGLWTWADDSGLAVDALDGKPGVHSARFGGDGLSDAQRCHYLLEQLQAHPERPRTARFHCVVALALPRAENASSATAVDSVTDSVIDVLRVDAVASAIEVETTEGVLEGCIVETPEGENGFGYDPVFYVPDLRMTLAQAAAEVKNRISHRAQAANRAKAILRMLLEKG